MANEQRTDHGSKVGKNNLLKISAAAVPYRKKSYHSMAVPIRLAVATLTCDGHVWLAVRWSCYPPVYSIGDQDPEIRARWVNSDNASVPHSGAHPCGMRLGGKQSKASAPNDLRYIKMTEKLAVRPLRRTKPPAARPCQRSET